MSEEQPPKRDPSHRPKKKKQKHTGPERQRPGQRSGQRSDQRSGSWSGSRPGPSGGERPRRERPNAPQDAYTNVIVIDGPHPTVFPEEALLKKCEMEFGRASGPGGQHRNKVSTAVNICHKETGVAGYAAERRKQYDNRRMAIRRLRLKLAMRVRTRVHWERHQASELWQSRRQGTQMSINPGHRDYPPILAEALDVIYARRFDVAGAAGVLGISISQIAKLLRHEKYAFGIVNEGRQRQGLPPLK